MSGIVKKIMNAEEYYIYHVRGRKKEKKKINDPKRKKIRENTVHKLKFIENYMMEEILTI